MNSPFSGNGPTDFPGILRHHGLAPQPPSLSPVTSHQSPVTPTQATTILAFKFADGVLVAGDRRATAGNVIMYDRADKVLEIDRHSLMAIAGVPATAWEKEIDTLMREQASTLDVKKRKRDIDRVQEIVWQQEPFIYLVNKDAMSAVSPSVHNAHPVVLRPQVYWNIDQLTLGTEVASNR